MDINSFAVLKIRLTWKSMQLQICRNCIPPKIKTIFNHVVFFERNYLLLQIRGLWACWLVDPSFRQICEREAIFVNKKSQSAKAKDFAVSAQMRREAWTRETLCVGQGVRVMMSCLHLTKGNTFCRCEHLFCRCDVFYWWQGSHSLPANFCSHQRGLLNVLHLQKPGPKALRFIKFPMFKKRFSWPLQGQWRNWSGRAAIEWNCGLFEVARCFEERGAEILCLSNWILQLNLWQKGIALTWKSWFRFSVSVKPVVFFCLEGYRPWSVWLPHFWPQKLDLRTLSCGSWMKRRMAVCGFCCSQKCRCEKHGGFWPIFWVWKKRHPKLRSETWGLCWWIMVESLIWVLCK